MESFQVVVAPPLPRLNVTATSDDLQTSPELFFHGSDIVWMLIASGLVLLMVPAMCLFYSGASTRPASLKLFRLPLITAALVSFQWYLWGYTLTFTPAVAPSSPSVSWYGWDPRGNALHDSLARPVGASGAKIPELLYEFYEGMFASFTAALVSGGTLRHVPAGRFLVFITLWSLFVYNPVARWSWHWAGWSNQYGVMDFAGGTAVHITSGTTVLAFHVFYELDIKGFSECWSEFWRILVERLKLLWPSKNISRPQWPSGDENDSSVHELESRSTTDHDPADLEAARAPQVQSTAQPPSEPLDQGPNADEPPHNVNNIVLGTALLWIGWLGFNGGSALGGNLRAVSACVSTHVAACSGGITSLLLFWLWNAAAEASSGEEDSGHKVPSVTHFCDGVVVGLVAITPAAGYVPVWSSGIIGSIAAIVVFMLKLLAKKMLADEPLFIFSIHAGGGMVGMFLTGCFASPAIVGLDGYSKIPDRTVAERLRYQMLDAFMGFLYTFVVTLLILYCLKVIRSMYYRAWSAGFQEAQEGHEARKWKLEAIPQHTWKRKDTAVISAAPDNGHLTSS